MFLVPVTFNGAPFYWPDSFAYLKGGGAALNAVLGVETRYVGVTAAIPVATPDRPTKAQADISAVAPTPSPPPDDRISKARSPYYAVFLAGSSAAFGPAAPVYLQALLLLAAMGMVLRPIFGGVRALPAALLLVALSLTSASLFTTLLLPDFLAPLGLMGAAALLAFWPRLSRGEIGFWYLVLLASILSHTTHLALALLVVPCAVVLARLIGKHPVGRPAILVLSAVVIGVLGNMAFTKAVERSFGYTPQSFPMLAASIFTDGTGRAYLEATCPENGYIYCDYLDNQATEVDQFLWSTDPALGVYARVTPDIRMQMSDQQWGFLIDTVRFDFWGQVWASGKRMWRQLCNNSLGQLGYVAQASNLAQLVPNPDLSGIQGSAVMRGAVNFQTLGYVLQSVGWAAALGLVWIMARAPNPALRGHTPLVARKTLVLFTAVVLIGILINAGLTGAASQPQGRYGARVFLLLPVLLALWGAWVQAQKPAD